MFLGMLQALDPRVVFRWADGALSLAGLALRGAAGAGVQRHEGRLRGEGVTSKSK